MEDDFDDPDFIDCPHCGKSISEEAQRCHHCGNYISLEDAPQRRKRWIVAGWILVALVIATWVLCK